MFFIRGDSMRRYGKVRYGAFCRVLVLIMVFGAFRPTVGHGQETGTSDVVSLNFPASVELRLLIDYVADRLSMNILYGDEVGRARVTLKSPAEVPVDALQGILESALRMNGLALVDADQPGWKRVITLQGMTATTRRVDDLAAEDQAGINTVVTQLIELRHTDPSRLEGLLRPFLTPQGGNLIIDAERRLLIITDFKSQVEVASALIERLDAPADPPVVQFIEAKHMPAPSLGQNLNQLLSSSQRLTGSRNTGGTSGSSGLEVTADERTNRLILIGPAELVESARKLAAELDQDLGLETRVYPLLHVAPERLDTLVRRLIDPMAVDRLYVSTVEAEGGYLVVSATPVIHQQIIDLQKQLDVPLTEVASPVRFYKLQNADAAEVLATIRAIEGGAGLEGIDLGSGPGPQFGAGVPGLPGGSPPPPPGIPPLALAAVQGREVTVTADENLNSIIVIADPAVQRVYQSLIKQLDQRRPQVMVEATIVTLDTSDGFTLGVEISGGDTAGDFQAFSFSSFGLSAIDDGDFGLDIIPGVGFNGAVLESDIADIVIQALKTDGRSRVVSAPKVLVNDNATGTISSVSEQPVSSINQGQNSDTVTFNGFVEAGTTISVTPQIAEGDHLRLEFEVALESFSGESSDTLPPPRSSNTVSSEVTIPDGSTIVVGGINRKDVSESVSRIPVLGEIPVLEYLFSSRSISESESTLFVFLRPVILRDDQFADLKFYSQRDVQRAEITPDYPASEPMLVK